VRFRLLLAAALPLALVLSSSKGARADEPTTWLGLGGGYAFQRNGVTTDMQRATVFNVALGVGTPNTNPLVVGGVFRSMTYFTLGTDISLSARFASGSFARGDFGLALDLGVAGRWWKGQDFGHFPLKAVLMGGLPYGFQVGVGADFWDVTGDRPAAAGGFALLEFDFLRLTVMRSGATTQSWPNPSPANGPRAPDAPDLP
jgi:hypothetical protein